jgi:hypothetical protein
MVSTLQINLNPKLMKKEIILNQEQSEEDEEVDF